MSEAQRCANVMRRYGLKHPPDSIQRGCYEATCRELERQEQEILALRKDAVRYRWLRDSSRVTVDADGHILICDGSGEDVLWGAPADLAIDYAMIAAAQPKEPTC